ncbi:MAG: asparagine synthetase B [Spirochaetes bacterium]|nr:asparagine synthetase B [Spirochaetota bacterium]
MKRIYTLLFIILFSLNLYADKILVPMDNTQTDHLHAYGLVYWTLTLGQKSEWLLNYKDGSFILDNTKEVAEKANLMGVSTITVNDADLTRIYQEIEENNMKRIFLNKAPKIAVYAPPFSDPWDDAVRLALEYADVPYTRLWDKEVLLGDLEKYDWLHLHHEDFTGQYGKFYSSFRNMDWYKKKVAKFRQVARLLGYTSVPREKRAVAKMIQDYVSKGGFLFAMCSATDTLDIALASDELDIVPEEIDGTGITPNAQEKLDFNRTFAFTDFKLVFDPYVYEFSDIDINIMTEGLYNQPDTFSLFEFSAKIDPVPTMLVQSHKNVIKGFLGQTTAYNRKVIKEGITILAETPNTVRVKYIHGEFNKGTFTFLAGHDPEDYRHLVGDPPTDLSLHKNSAGFRLILNNILYPAAKKNPQKT